MAWSSAASHLWVSVLSPVIEGTILFLNFHKAGALRTPRHTVALMGTADQTPGTSASHGACARWTVTTCPVPCMSCSHRMGLSGSPWAVPPSEVPLLKSPQWALSCHYEL